LQPCSVFEQELKRVMNYSWILLFVLVSLSAFSQKQSVGVRLGDPMSVTYKKFVSRDRAFEIMVGSAPAHWHNNYYINSFNEYPEYDEYRYQNHTVQSTLYLQARYLLHYPVQMENLIGKVDWYWGVGGMLKSAKVQYRFQERDAPFIQGTDIKNDLDFGPEGIVGLEYTFQDAPLTLFGEGSLLLEIADRPLTPRGFGCLGVRISF
jgi:hypothetical protein